MSFMNKYVNIISKVLTKRLGMGSDGIILMGTGVTATLKIVTHRQDPMETWVL